MPITHYFAVYPYNGTSALKFRTWDEANNYRMSQDFPQLFSIRAERP